MLEKELPGTLLLHDQRTKSYLISHNPTIQGVHLVFRYVHVPSTNLKETGLITYTAASYQVVIPNVLASLLGNCMSSVYTIQNLEPDPRGHGLKLQLLTVVDFPLSDKWGPSEKCQHHFSSYLDWKLGRHYQDHKHGHLNLQCLLWLMRCNLHLKYDWLPETEWQCSGVISACSCFL